LKPVVEIRISAAVSVRPKRSMIEAKDIHPPEIRTGPSCIRIVRSSSGLTMPMTSAKGEARSSLPSR
jgi:hypothetical protein